MGVARYNLGHHEAEVGNLKTAREHFTAALECAAASGNRLLELAVAGGLISLSCAENDFESARGMAESLLQSGRETHEWPAMTVGLDALADIADHHEKYADPRKFLEQKLALYPEAAWIGRTNTPRMLGVLATKQADYVAARSYLDQSLAVCQEWDDLSHEGSTYLELAATAHVQGSDQEALADAKQALRLFDLLGQPWRMADCLLFMARLAVGLPEQALFLWSAYERVAKENDYPSRVGRPEEIAAAFALLQSTMPAGEFDTIKERCTCMSWREAVRYAYSDAITIINTAATACPRHHELSL